MVAWVFGGSPTTGLVLATAAAVTLGAMATAPGAVVAAVLSWACYDGFVLHSLGTLEDGHADLVALAVVVLGALAAQLVGTVARHRDHRESHPEALPGALPHGSRRA